MRVRHAGIGVVLALLAPAQGRPAAAPASCESLTSLRLPNVTITSAAAVAAGAFTPPTAAPGRGVPPALARAMAAAPAFCRVALTSRPTADSDIKIDVLAAGIRLERQTAGRRQRRVGLHDQLPAARSRRRARLRGGEHGQWPHHARRLVRGRASGKTCRLRASIAA